MIHTSLGRINRARAGIVSARNPSSAARPSASLGSISDSQPDTRDHPQAAPRPRSAPSKRISSRSRSQRQYTSSRPARKFRCACAHPSCRSSPRSTRLATRETSSSRFGSATAVPSRLTPIDASVSSSAALPPAPPSVRTLLLRFVEALASPLFSVFTPIHCPYEVLAP